MSFAVKSAVVVTLGWLSVWATSPTFAADGFFSATGSFSVNSGAFEDFSFFTSGGPNFTVRTWAAEGGINAAGIAIPPGGIDSILTLFDSANAQIATNDNTIGLDSLLSFAPLPPGGYRLRLTNFGTSVGDGHWATDIVADIDSLSNNYLVVNARSGSNSRLSTLSWGTHDSNSNYTFLNIGSAATLTVDDDLRVGASGLGYLMVHSGATVTNTDGYVGYSASSTGGAEVHGSGSQWYNSGYLVVGGHNYPGVVHIFDNGLVHATITQIGTSGAINLSSGRLEFGQTSLTEFGRINATGGSLAGSVHHTGYTNAATLTVLQNTAVDMHEVVLTNSGTLYGNAALFTALGNTGTGEVEVMTGERLVFGGAGSTNAGQVYLFGGQLKFTNDFTNSVGGFISGNGTLIAFGGLTNSGTMNFSGVANVVGDTTNAVAGKIISAGGGPTTFYDDVVNQGDIRTSQGSFSVFFGTVSGAGSFSGPGTVNFEGDLNPGNSPAAVSFGGNVVLSDATTTTIELDGTTAGGYDQLLVAGNLDRGGSVLNVALYNGFQPHTGDYFADIYSAGSLSGSFGIVTGLNLGDGMLLNPISTATSLSLLAALPGDANLDRRAEFTDLGILLNNYNTGGFAGVAQWNAGDFNDDHSVDFIDLGILLNNYNQQAPLVAATATVPEPSTLWLATFGALSLLLAARRRRLRL